MKIPLTVGKLFPGEERLLPLVFVVVTPSKHPSIRIPTNALVDTGSGRSCISPRDILRTRISYKTLPPATPRHIRIGGLALPAFNLGSAILAFMDDKGEKAQLEVSAMNVLGVPPGKGGFEHIPTILGNDFLEDNGFTLVFNPSKKEAYLEK